MKEKKKLQIQAMKKKEKKRKRKNFEELQFHKVHLTPLAWGRHG